MAKAQILIVEDDGIVAMDIESRLKNLGYAVSGIVIYAEKAIEKVEELKPDLVLMDIVLKGEMDGIEAAEIIRSRFDIPIIFVTAYADEKRFERAKLAIPFGYILKPFRDRDLKITIEMALYSGKIETERKQAVEALRESEEKYHQLFELSSDALFLIEIETGQILDLNKAVLEVYGYSREEALQMKNIDFSSEPEKTRQATVESETLIPIRYHRKKDGTVFPVDISVCYFTLHEKKVCVAAIRDITERVMKEKVLQKSEEKYRSLLNNVNAGVVAHAPDTTILYCNHTALQLLGLTMDQMIGKAALDPQWKFLNEDKTVMVLDDFPINHTLKTQTELKGYVTGIMRPDKDYVAWVLCNSFFVIDDGGELDYVLISFIDITDRKRAEEDLKQSETNLLQAQAIAHIGSWELDLTSNHLTWSDETYRIFGLGPQEFEATYEAFLDAIHPDDRAAVDAAYSGSVRDRKDGYEIAHRIVRKATGEIRHVEEKCIHYRDEKGEIGGSIGTVHDVTDRKDNEKLRRKTQELESFNEEMLDREERIIELKEKVNSLAQELGRPTPYESVWGSGHTETEGGDE